METREEEVEEVLRKSLKNRFSLYEEEHKINVFVKPVEKLHVGYRTSIDEIMGKRGATFFDLEINNNICYLLYLQLDKNSLGSGIGWSLYESIHYFAGEVGCEAVRQTPSGKTINGESRKDYLLRRWYNSFGENGEVEFRL